MVLSRFMFLFMLCVYKNSDVGDEILEGKGKTVAAADKYKHVRRPDKNNLRVGDRTEIVKSWKYVFIASKCAELCVVFP